MESVTEKNRADPLPSRAGAEPFELPHRDGPRPMPKAEKIEVEPAPLAERVSFADPILDRPPPRLFDILQPRTELPLTRDPSLSDFDRLREMYLRNYVDARAFLEVSEQIPWQKPAFGGRPTTYTVTQGLRLLESIETAKLRKSIRLKTNLAGSIGIERSTLDGWVKYGSEIEADPRVRAFSVVYHREVALLSDDYFDQTMSADVTDARTAGKLMAGMYPKDASENRETQGVNIHHTTVNIHNEMLDVITGGKPIVDVTPSDEPDREFPLLPMGQEESRDAA